MICRREAGTGVRPSIVMEQLQGGEEEPLKLQLESFLTAVATGAGRSSPVRTVRRRWIWRIRC